MNAPEQRLTAAAKEVLEAHRPAGIPADFAIRTEQETEKLERPYLVVSAENAETPHPSMRKIALVLTTRRRADDESTGPGEELHQRFVNALESHLPEFAGALTERQLRALKMVAGPTTEEIVEGRAESSTATWTMWLEILPPPN
jgi:hypothetical protein